MQNRLKKIKEAMAAKGIEALLVTKSENQIYLTGFHSSNCQLVITADTNYLLTDFRYIEAAGELAPLYHVVLTDHDVTLYTFLKELDIKELAIEDSSLTYAEFKQLEEKVGCAVSGDGIIEGVRVIR